MKRWILSSAAALSFGLCGCGGDEPDPEPLPEEEQLDPYRSPMSERINQVIYRTDKPGRMLPQLALLGVQPGKPFADFKEESGIDDWFEIESASGGIRYVSLTCGLSPVVDGDGKITSLYRGRKLIDGKMHEEMEIVAE